MKILILGGTGAMGRPLVKILSEDKDNSVYVVSRKPRTSQKNNVHYIQGNAFNKAFLQEVLWKGYDTIIDFMIWEPSNLEKMLPLIFEHCGHYITMGTASEYVGTDDVLTEKTPRLYDTYSGKERAQDFRYHIKKSRAEDLIMRSPYGHWTIARPWVTFNSTKDPLVTVPLSVWLWRYLNDKTILLPQEAMDKRCALTYGDDAARAISKFIGNPKAFGQVVNIATNRSMTWAEAIEIYQEVLMELGGKAMKIYLLPDYSEIWKNIPSQFDPLVRDRFYNRSFSTDKLNEICGEVFEFSDFRESLKTCLQKALSDPECLLGPPAPEFNGLMDRLAGEHTPLYMYENHGERRAYSILRSAFKSWAKRVYRYVRNKDCRYLYGDA